MINFTLQTNYQNAEDEKYQILEDLSVKHDAVESNPDGSLFSRIKEEEHVYVYLPKVLSYLSCYFPVILNGNQS